jgi:hypothetical protein|tara:strand:+ start:406 stop:690 length:285 start_codon:yes stop_codon:yes gene_type:complete
MTFTDKPRQRRVLAWPSHEKYYQEVEGYQREWQEQEEAKNAWHKRCMEAESILADCCMLMEDTAEAEHDGERWCGNDEMILCGKIDDHFRKYVK